MTESATPPAAPPAPASTPPATPPATPPPAPTGDAPVAPTFTQADVDNTAAAARKAAASQRDREIAKASGFDSFEQMQTYLKAKRDADDASLDETQRLTKEAASDKARADAAELALAQNTVQNDLTDVLLGAGIKPEALKTARQIATPQVLAATPETRQAAIEAAVGSLRSDPATIGWFPVLDANGQTVPPVATPPTPGTPPPSGAPAPTPPPPADGLARGKAKAEKFAAGRNAPKPLKTL